MLKITSKNTCCFTGHRPDKLPWREDERDTRCVVLKEKIRDAVDAVYQAGIHHYICGMALGCDMYFSEAVISLRNEHPEITLEAAIPCETQSQYWNEADRNRYFYIVAQCDYETLLQRRYSSDCMLRRNRYMVDHSSILIAVFDGSFGGTMHTFNYAKKRGLEIIHIVP